MTRGMGGGLVALLLVTAGCDLAKSPSTSRYERVVQRYLQQKTRDSGEFRVESISSPMSAKQFNLRGEGLGIRVKYRAVGDSGALESHDEVLVFDARGRVLRSFQSKDLKLK